MTPTVTDCLGDTLLERGDRRLIRCASCGYVHVSPMYTDVELEDFYKNHYAESTPSPNWAEKVWNVRRLKEGGRILDFGCWEGRQLEEFAQSEKWDCTGIELNTRAAEVARSKGITVHSMTLEQFFEQLRGQKWDIINLAYVLEHLPDALGVLERLRGFLAPDGILIVEVPNEFSPFQLAYLKATGVDPYWIALPDHVNYFDRASLEAAVVRAGYEIIHRESTFPMEIFLAMGENYIGRPDVGKACFEKVVRMEGILRHYDPGLVSEMYAGLYQAEIGRALVLYLKVRV